MTTKKIEIVSLELTNFKGAKHFKLEPNGTDVDIYGKNGAGKTTIYDAFTWCLFHKDSREKTDFDFEPQGTDVDEIAGVSVSLTLKVDGQSRNFTKELNKKKNVKSNQIIKDPAYYVDDLKLKTKKAYDEKVAELIDKDKFKFLTNGSYFMDNLKASERREILFEYFGSKTDEEIINENKDLKPLLKYLVDGPLDEANQRLQQKKQSLEKTIKEINPQIKGIRKAMPEIDLTALDGMNAKKAEILDSISKTQQEILELENGLAITDKKNLVKEKQSQLRIAESEYAANQKEKTADLEEKRSELLKEYYEVENRLTEAVREAKQVKDEIESNESYIKKLETELANYGKQLDEIDARTFSFPEFVPETFDEHALSCPTCKRAWETDDQEKLKEEFNERHEKNVMSYSLAKEKALKEFSNTNDVEFDRINQLGKETSENIELLTEKIADLKIIYETKNNHSVLEDELVNIKAQGDKLKEQIKTINDGLEPFVESEEYETIQSEIAEIEKEIAELNKSVQSQVQDKKDYIAGIQEELSFTNSQLSKIDEYNRQQSVIEQLIQDEKNMSAEKGEIEVELLLFENFFIKKVSLLEENINQHFRFIKFKLFDYHDNGNLNEAICEPELNDVKYRDMSNGEQIKARIDICDTLMRAEKIYVPLFLDNADGLTEDFVTDTQVLALYASKKDRSLRIDIHDTKEEVAA